MPYQTFRGHIPNDRLYSREYDMWVQISDTGSGEILIGATTFGLYLAGEVIAFTAKPRGARIDLGRGLGTIECRKTVLAVHAPLSFALEFGNEAAESRPSLINTSPYHAGWLARGKPLAWANEEAMLCDAWTYRAHILSSEPDASFDD